MYPIIRFEEKKKTTVPLKRKVIVVFIDEKGNKIGPSININKFLSICELGLLYAVSDFYSPTERYQQMVKFPSGDYANIYYSKDRAGEKFLYFNKESIDFNPMVLGSKYIDNTFKRSR